MLLVINVMSATKNNVDSVPPDDVDTIRGGFTAKVRQLPCSEQPALHH